MRERNLWGRRLLEPEKGWSRQEQDRLFSKNRRLFLDGGRWSGDRKAEPPTRLHLALLEPPVRFSNWVFLRRPVARKGHRIERKQCEEMKQRLGIRPAFCRFAMIPIYRNPSAMSRHFSSLDQVNESLAEGERERSRLTWWPWDRSRVSLDPIEGSPVRFEPFRSNQLAINLNKLPTWPIFFMANEGLHGRYKAFQS